MLNRKKKSNPKKNIFIIIISILSTIVISFFSFLLFKSNMFPLKYLLLFLIIIAIIYLIMFFVVLNHNVNQKIKIFCCILFIIFGIIFGIGINYVAKTMNFFDEINDELYQKDTFYLITLENSKIENINELKNKNVGIYNLNNYTTALKELNKKINIEALKYDDIEKMLNDLKNNNIDAVLVNNYLYNFIEEELNYEDLKLKKIYEFSAYIDKKNNSDDVSEVIDVTKTTFNVYIAGGDAYGDINNVTNTDVNMIVTINPVDKKILLTSIPRDYYVNLPSFGDNAYDKLTHAGYYGIEESISTVEKLLDTDINYYVKVNFSTIENVIDAIDGVDVYSDYSFCANGRPDICYSKGLNHLNGFYALMFARERYAFSDGDIQRVKNQQKVLEATTQKVTSSASLIMKFDDILDSVSGSLSTNMDTSSINKFIKMQLNDMASWKIEKQNLTGTDFYSTSTYSMPGLNLYVMKPDEDSIIMAKDKIKQWRK